MNTLNQCGPAPAPAISSHMMPGCCLWVIPAEDLAKWRGLDIWPNKQKTPQQKSYSTWKIVMCQAASHCILFFSGSLLVFESVMKMAFSDVNQSISWGPNWRWTIKLLPLLPSHSPTGGPNLQPESRFLGEKILVVWAILRVTRFTLCSSDYYNPLWESLANQCNGMGGIFFGPQVVDLVPVWLKKVFKIWSCWMKHDRAKRNNFGNPPPKRFTVSLVSFDYFWKCWYTFKIDPLHWNSGF